MTNVNKRKITIIASLFVCILVLLLLVLNTSIVFADTNGETQFEKTNVLDDLKSSDGFDIIDYPFDSTGLIKHPEIMNVVEYCYSFKANMRKNYGLYLYFYNPQGLNIDADSRANKVQLAVSYDKNKDGETVPTAYEKFDLKFCSVSIEPNYYHLFYKFKVVDCKGADGKTIAERVNSNARRYDISGVELLAIGDRNATEYTVGGSYIFTGYAKGYGADEKAESNLTCSVRNLETVSLDLSGKDDGIDKRTYWRSNSSSLGAHHQNQINSVFFAIDKNVLNKYGYTLQKIKAEWWEYKTAPAIVIDNKDIYDRLAKYNGVSITDTYDRNRGLTLYNSWYNYVGGTGYGNTTYQYSWNAQLYTNGAYVYKSDYNDTILPLLFYTGGTKVDDYILLPEMLQERFDTYNKSYVNGHLTFNGKDYSADLFTNSVDKGRTLGYNLREFDIGNPDDYWDIHSYDDTHSWWNKLWDYGFGSIVTNDTYMDIPPIQMVTPQDMAVSDLATHLKINADDIDDFRKYYNKVKNDCEVFIFRYAVTDYWAEDLTVYDIENDKSYPYDSIGEHNPHVGEVRQGTQFFDFDIIEFTFNNNGVYTVIPVVNSPIDHISGYTPSIEPEFNDLWKIILGVLLLIVLCVLFAPILPYIIQAIVWVVLLPFKVIAAIFNGVNKSTRKKSRTKKRGK